MPRGGKREGAGRPEGAATKRTREAAEKASAEGMTPLDFMLGLLRDDSQDLDKRMWAAEKSAPYVHPKLAAVDHKVSGGLDVTFQTFYEAPPKT